MKRKILYTIIIISMIELVLTCTRTYARLDTTGTSSVSQTSSSTGGIDGTTIISEGKSFTNVNAVITTSDVISKLLPIGKVLVSVATAVVVIVGLIMGIKYMIAGADEKANLKEKLIWYVISIVLIYGAVGIATIIINLAQSVIA